MTAAAAGGVLTWRHWSDGSVFDRDGTPAAFGVVVAVELALAGVGAALLVRRRGELVPAWVALLASALVSLAGVLL